MADEKMTCEINYEAEYNRLLEENAKLKMKLEYLDGAGRENQILKAKLEMVYLIFGRE